MTNTEAIELLKKVKALAMSDQKEAFDMAISALEKQEAKKPHRNYDNYSAMWCQCGWYLGFVRDGNKYCPNCGQRIDWSED